MIIRISGKRLRIDVGLAAAYGGHRACLIIEGGEYFALHRSRKQKIPLQNGEPLISHLRTAAKLEPQPNPLLQLIRTLDQQAAAK